MKIIDLLNKIANGEEIPGKIKYDRKIYHYGNYIKWYISDNLWDELFIDKNNLNDEIEIIEDIPKEDTPKEEKKIAKIGKLNQVSNNKQHLNNYILRNKINEIIDRLNGGEE